MNVADKKAAKHEADEAAVRSELKGGDGGAASPAARVRRAPDTLAHAVPASTRRLLRAWPRPPVTARRFVVSGVADETGAARGREADHQGVGLFQGEYTVTDVPSAMTPRRGCAPSSCATVPRWKA